jgi:hypothetical protein
VDRASCHGQLTVLRTLLPFASGAYRLLPRLMLAGCGREPNYRRHQEVCAAKPVGRGMPQHRHAGGTLALCGLRTWGMGTYLPCAAYSSLH